MPTEIETNVNEQVLNEAAEDDQKSAKSDGSDEDHCSICLDKLTEKAVAHPCHHECFDFICLTSWLQEQPRCPLCKSSVEYVEHNWTSPDGPSKYVVPQPEPDPVLPSIRHLATHAGLTQPMRAGPEHEPLAVEGSGAVTSLRSLERRKAVYVHGLRCLHVGTNQLSGFRDVPLARFRADERLRSRARAWIRREVQALRMLHLPAWHCAERLVHTPELLSGHIMSRLEMSDLQASNGELERVLGALLGREYARTFLHELRAWLRSPHPTLDAWDRHVQYEVNLDSLVARDRAAPRGPRRSDVYSLLAPLR